MVVEGDCFFIFSNSLRTLVWFAYMGLKVIGRRDDDKCDCGSTQNAAHLLQSPRIGDGKGRTMEECYGD